MGIICLVADLGSPNRLLLLVVAPKPSVITIGAYALGVSFFVSLLFFVGANFDGIRISPAAIYVMGGIGVATGATCILYTGVLLGGFASVLFWQTWLLPLVFVLSSLSCGIALVFLAAAFVDARQVIVRSLVKLAYIDGALILLELVSLAIYIMWGMKSDGTFYSAYSLIAGDLAALFWGGVIVLGLILPLILGRFIAHGNRSTQLTWISAAVLFGGLFLRICIVDSGNYDVSQMYSLAINSIVTAVS